MKKAREKEKEKEKEKVSADLIFAVRLVNLITYVE